MKVFIVSEGFPTPGKASAGIFAWDQAKALKAIGVDVTFLVLDCRSIRRWRRWGYQHFITEGIPVFRIDVPLGKIPDGIFLWFSKRAFVALIRKAMQQVGKPDILHAHFLKTGASVVMASKRHGIPLVITEHSSWLNKQNISARIVARFQPAYSHADKVIAVSKPLEKSMHRHFGIKATTIHNMTDTDLFTFSATQRGWKEVRVVTCGGLIKRKRHDMTIRAFANLLKEYHNAQLKVLGGGPEMENLKQLCEQLDCEKNVQFFGTVDRSTIAKEFQESDFFVLPSALETFGVVYIEAMAAGLPVIATACGGPEDFVDSSNGILISVDDQQAYNEAMLRMAKEHSKYDRAEISQHIRERFSSKVIAQQLLQVYKRVTEAGDRR